MVLRRRIFKQGNSLVVAVPAYMWAEIGCEIGDKVDITPIPGRMITIELAEKKGQAVNIEGKIPA